MSRYTHFPRLEYNVPDREIFQGQNKFTTAFMVTGVLHIVLGSISVILGGAGIGMMSWFSYFAVPIWTGILFFGTTGVLGILSAFSKRRPLKVAYLFMCLLSAWFAFGMVGLYSYVSIQEFTTYYISGYLYPVCSPGVHWIHPCWKNMHGRRAIDMLIVLIAIAETIVCIVGSAFACCKSCDCCEPCCREACGCCLNCCDPPPLYEHQVQTSTGYQQISAQLSDESPRVRGHSPRHSNASPATIPSDNLFVVQTSQRPSRTPSPYSAGRTDLTDPPHQINLGFEDERSSEAAGPVPEKKD